MYIGNLEVKNPVFLAPMAGVTDWAYRTVCAELGAGVTVTEMVSSRALVYQDKKSRKLLRKNEGSICGAQIFGNDPEIMAEGARLALEISGCDFIDINMGCPMPKIANSGDGCGLMRTPELAGDIVKAVTKAVLFCTEYRPVSGSAGVHRHNSPSNTSVPSSVWPIKVPSRRRTGSVVKMTRYCIH